MNIEQIRKYCLALPGATESIKWEDHLCFSVADKMFYILNPDAHPINGSFKTTPGKFDELTAKPGFKPAPYLAKHKWVYFDGLDVLSNDEWKEVIDVSYQLVFEKLPAKVRKGITDK